MPKAKPATMAWFPPVIGTMVVMEYVAVIGMRLNAGSEVFKGNMATALDLTETANAYASFEIFGEWQFTLVSLAHEERTQSVAKNRN